MKWLIVLMAGATGLFYYASQSRNRGSMWIDQLCSNTSLLCEQPRWMLIAFCLVTITCMYRVLIRASG